MRPVPGLNGLEAIAEGPHGRRPIDLLLPPAAVAQQRKRGPIVGLEHPQRLPALGTRHAEIHGIVRVGREIDRLALFQVDLQAAAGGAEAADHRGHGIGRLPGRNLSQAEPAGDTIELLRQGTGPLVEKRKQFVVCAVHEAGDPGILGATTAAKSRQRSNNSPAKSKATIRIATMTIRAAG